MGRTVNPLSFDFRGSNPLLPTLPEIENRKLKIENGENGSMSLLSIFDFGFSTLIAGVAQLVER
jgi:hypothetical protein